MQDNKFKLLTQISDGKQYMESAPRVCINGFGVTSCMRLQRKINLGNDIIVLKITIILSKKDVVLNFGFVRLS